MGALIYSAITSLDGYVADEAGNFEWAAPDEQVHAAVNELVDRAGIQLFGRRMYDVLAAWETIDAGPDVPAVVRDFAAIWRAADKVVYSTTLDVARSARTRIERRFDPDAVRTMKDTAERDLTIGGPRLAGEALRHGLVDECHVFINPVVVGGGTAWLSASLRLRLELVESRRFDNGVVHLHYRPQPGERLAG
ncbi:MAG: dihydrofolate reductase family protein [Blastococcus sp.]